MNNLAIKKQIQTLESEVNSLKGKTELLNKQLEDSIVKQKDLQSQQDLNIRATELLHFVKKITEEKIKNMFERVVGEALCFIYQNNDYQFKLYFDRRGNLPILNFAVHLPDMIEKHDILSVSAGGNRDIMALALRFVLLEVSKMPGFLILDEPVRRLDNTETINQTMKFIKELQSRTKRQIIIIAHEQEVVDNADNSIIITKSNQKRLVEIKEDNSENLQKCSKTEMDKHKKKRGRKPKNAKKD